MKRKLLSVLGMVLLCSGLAAFAADLSIDYQVNTAAKDYANNYLTFTGAPVKVVKDQFVPGPDAVSGASKSESTAMFNVYRFDIFGGKLLPGGLRSFFLYPVADDGTRTGDALAVAKAADGVITVRYIHRGTAYEFSTDTKGQLVLPTTAVKTRVIGTTDNKNISTDFSADGTVAKVDWKKVWDSSIADGKQIGTTTSKTGKIAADVATSNVYIWSGALQFSFDGKILKVMGDLSAKAPK
jgi:hypothetical protein